jgi:hypothetical protein
MWLLWDTSSNSAATTFVSYRSRGPGAYPNDLTRRENVGNLERVGFKFGDHGHHIVASDSVQVWQFSHSANAAQGV